MASPLDDAIHAIQHSGINLVKDAKAVYGEYATLGNVLDKLRPEFKKQGLLVEQAPDIYEQQPCLTTRLALGDEDRVYHTPLVEQSSMQKIGSSITYARRYALVSIFLMDADEDDDAGATAGSVQKKRAGKKKEDAPNDAGGVVI